MYAKIVNQQVIAYPYSIQQLRNENPQTTFPETREMLESMGCFHVVAKGKPAYNHTQNCEESAPTYNAEKQQWEQTWVLVAASQQEIDERTTQQAELIRRDRNAMLSACDWTQVSDAPVDSLAWANYRQALRDIPSQAGFPWEVVWPETP